MFVRASALLCGLAASSAALAENLDVLMSSLFAPTEVRYIGFDSVEREDIPRTSAVDRKYLIVDFRFDIEPPAEQLQANVHKICMALIGDRELIRSLSAEGYDMIAVAFDRHSQYDCL
ncbi:hypothetical protein BG841_08305 [Marinobacter sp. X15-166B]|nr:hypothetical protein BG841_08305 [Marinobacter sp. X15-166B]